MSPAVLLEGLRFRYQGGGGFALSVDHLEIAPGESFALTGPSGCGKTTLAGLVTGVLVAEAGRVCVAGRDISSMKDSARREFRIAKIGILFQDFGLLEYLTALDNILLPYHLDPSPGDLVEARRRALALAGELGIDGRLRSKPEALSAGERQRVAIARALVTEPALVVADEPTGNLDPDNAARAIDLLLGSVAARGAALFTITHDPAVAGRHGRTSDLTRLTGPPAPSRPA